jgi:hypothetical protein
MKKIYLLGGLLLSLFACDTEQVQPEALQEEGASIYSIENGILNFSSQEEYQLFIESEDAEEKEVFVQTLDRNDSYTSLKKA